MAVSAQFAMPARGDRYRPWHRDGIVTQVDRDLLQQRCCVRHSTPSECLRLSVKNGPKSRFNLQYLLTHEGNFSL